MVLDLATLKGDQQDLQRGSFTSNFWSLPYGKCSIMVLPPFPNHPRPYKPVYLHFGFTGGNGRPRVYLCSMDKYKTCPICIDAENQKKSGVPDNKIEIARDKRFLYNILDPDGNHKLFTAKSSQHSEILAEMISRIEDENIDITCYDTMGVIQLTRQKTEPYCRARVTQTGPLPKEFRDGITLTDLDGVYIDNTPEELLRALQGEDINSSKFVQQEVAPGVASTPPLAGRGSTRPVLPTPDEYIAKTVQEPPVAHVTLPYVTPYTPPVQPAPPPTGTASSNVDRLRSLLQK